MEWTLQQENWNMWKYVKAPDPVNINIPKDCWIDPNRPGPMLHAVWCLWSDFEAHLAVSELKISVLLKIDLVYPSLLSRLVCQDKEIREKWLVKWQRKKITGWSLYFTKARVWRGHCPGRRNTGLRQLRGRPSLCPVPAVWTWRGTL